MTALNILALTGWFVLIASALVFTVVFWQLIANWPPRIKKPAPPQAFKSFQYDNRPSSQIKN